MFIVGISLIIIAAGIFYYAAKKLFKEKDFDQNKTRIFSGILGLAFVLLCIGILIIVQVQLGPEWPMKLY